ncbi:MAG: NosD domain-containing protein [Candidatus Odinarchaeota archaeon]
MKSILKGSLAILLIFFTLIFTLSMNNSIYSNKTIKNFEADNKNIELSYSLGRIYINNNWSEAKNAGICTGEGTYSNPYVIEDLVINGGETDRGIYIANSSDFFKINNCTIFDCSVGITLSNVNNSQLINNKIYNNSFGIGLIFSYKNNITLNNIFNSFEGLKLYYCYHNNFSGNRIHNNFIGLSLTNCYNNNIIQNNISQNFRLFIDSPITGANTTSGIGIEIINSSCNLFSENAVNQNYDAGIILSCSNE